jgi:hypothetical protein
MSTTKFPHTKNAAEILMKNYICYVHSGHPASGPMAARGNSDYSDMLRELMPGFSAACRQAAGMLRLGSEESNDAKLADVFKRLKRLWGRRYIRRDGDSGLPAASKPAQEPRHSPVRPFCHQCRGLSCGARRAGSNRSSRHRSCCRASRGSEKR